MSLRKYTGSLMIPGKFISTSEEYCRMRKANRKSYVLLTEYTLDKVNANSQVHIFYDLLGLNHINHKNHRTAGIPNRVLSIIS